MKSNITTARRVHFTPFQASSTWCGPPPSPTGCPILLVSSPHRWHVKSLRLGIELVGDDFAPSTYISFTPTFKYLGTVVSWDLRECNDVQARIKAANKLFGSAKATFWSNSRVPFELRMRFYKAIIVNVLLWGCESWAIQSKEVHNLRVFQFRCLRSILKINVMHKVLRVRILDRIWKASRRRSSSCQSRRHFTDYRIWRSSCALSEAAETTKPRTRMGCVQRHSKL